MSDTPETEAAYKDVVISTEAGDSLPKATAMLKLARRLERERDEARAALADEMERGKVLRGMLELRVNEWHTTKEATPEEGEWVLHTFAGCREPCYGPYVRGSFRHYDYSESVPTTHWLRVPMIEKWEEASK